MLATEGALLSLEQFFNEQMEDALRMLNAHDAYWSGFTFGLLGFYGGDRLPVTRWHELLLDTGNDTLIARGYREGIRVMTEAAGGRVPYRPAAPAREPANTVS